MLLLLLSLFSRVRGCTTPEMAAHQAPLSTGFSRQAHWSRLPFPSLREGIIPVNIRAATMPPSLTHACHLHSLIHFPSSGEQVLLPVVGRKCYYFKQEMDCLLTFWLHCAAFQILVPGPGIEPMLPCSGSEES